jgi:hypothetical protein
MELNHHKEGNKKNGEGMEGIGGVVKVNRTQDGV